jgi:hypothetical protein
MVPASMPSGVQRLLIPTLSQGAPATPVPGKGEQIALNRLLVTLTLIFHGKTWLILT